MANAAAYKEVCKKDFNPARVAELAARSPECLAQAIAGLSEAQATIKYGCDKVLRYLAAHSPEVLYPHFDEFAANLDSEKTILKWGAIEILSRLATIDSEHKFEAVFDNYFAPIGGPVLITAANIIKASARIAKAQPKLANRIAKQLLSVEEAKYMTAECRQIALCQAVRSFDEIFDLLDDKSAVTEFVRRRLKSHRNSTRQAALKFFKQRK